MLNKESQTQKHNKLVLSLIGGTQIKMLVCVCMCIVCCVLCVVCVCVCVRHSIRKRMVKGSRDLKGGVKDV